MHMQTRALSLDEGSLRATCRSTLERLILARAAHWKQRGKFRAIVEGDENSKFFHARASQRLRRNSNRTLDIGGVADAAHDAKAAALFSYYSNLLGWRPAVQWEFDVNALYSGCPRVNGDALVGAFSPLEIEAAINSLDRASAPGPDGFGPAFYRAIWATAHPALLRLFKNFHSCSVDLERINRSHIVLLPKPAAVVTAASFRPVSLQNCSVKTLCKALTFRLQQQIGALIDVDQTGFLTGWSISENFIATELVQTCYRRKAPTVVLKLDFAKAFDSVSWSSLLRGDARQGFPYALTYLGLPLSAEKLRLAAFNPLIAKVDRYLSDWRALLLFAGGRVVLLNAVLDALPTFTMGALELPPGVLATLDRLRRAFLWATTDKVNGAQCLVAWDRLFCPKNEGGMGVRSIADQNTCLLLKLLHRLHCVPGESWPRISRVKVGDGMRAAFWLDWWVPSGPLATTMPELFSHCSLQGASVRQRSLPLRGKAGGKLCTSALYKLRTFGGVQDEHHQFIWGCCAPSRVKFFGWLAVKDRIQCRSNLLCKGILAAADSGCPICTEPLETTSHILFGCPFARRFWASLGASPNGGHLASSAANCALPSATPPGSTSTLRLLCLWQLWKHMNDVVFNELAPSIVLIRKLCRDDTVLWRARLPLERRPDVDVWLSFFLH
ncbi:uncharacterized protein [Lolium perenne]|uniref:uncharacterized protein n=1 Tax=Lolium perenne TaxID=4522 RepID=UPI003A991AF7